MGVAVLVSAVGPVLATLRSDNVPLHIEHLPERFALLVILVLGEAVGGAARGVHDASWRPIPVVVGALAFVVAAGMWWIYFDITATSSGRELNRSEQDAEAAEAGSDAPVTDSHATDARHDLFVYGHLPLAFGVVLAGVGLEELVVRPDTAAPSVAGWVLATGLAIFLVGVSLVISGTLQTLRSIWPWPVAAIPLVLVGATLPVPGSLVMVAMYGVGMLVLAVQGTRVSRRPETALAGAN
jgi:low temperature requirement protein LtrA